MACNGITSKSLGKVQLQMGYTYPSHSAVTGSLYLDYSDAKLHRSTSIGEWETVNKLTSTSIAITGATHTFTNLSNASYTSVTGATMGWGVSHLLGFTHNLGVLTYEGNNPGVYYFVAGFSLNYSSTEDNGYGVGLMVNGAQPAVGFYNGFGYGDSSGQLKTSGIIEGLVNVSTGNTYHIGAISYDSATSDPTLEYGFLSMFKIN